MIKILHDIFDNLDDDENGIEFQGQCHDCKKEMSVIIDAEPDGFHITGGAVYFPENNPTPVYLKCLECYERDSVLRFYRECEVYSRVVGYMRPVKQWNDAKNAEFNDRKFFKLKKP